MADSSIMERMTKKENFKRKLLKFLLAKKQSIDSEIESLRTDMMNETKSSAGDKFETAREMIQQSLNLQETQAEMIEKQLKLCHEISLEGSEKVNSGSLISTNTFTFFIGIALGKIEVEKNTFFLLSEKAPLAQALLGKRVGDYIEFRSQRLHIKSID